MNEHSERVDTEIAPDLRAGRLVGTSLLGPSFVAASSEHGAVVVDLLEAQQSQELGALFIEGARRAAAIAHPAAVPMLGFGQTAAGETYVIRPSFEGETATALIARRPARIPPVEALRLVGDMLEVLAIGHERGLTHGALTTDDVFIAEDGSVRVLGLGWCELRERIAQRMRALPLPVAFAAPERIANPRRKADESSDVWSAGAVLFALLTGELPYEGQSDEARIASALERPPKALTELFGEAPIALARLVDTALDPDPERRFTLTRMRAVVRDCAQLPELFLLRNLRSHQITAPVSGPRRSPSAELAAGPTGPEQPPITAPVSSVPPSGVRDPSHPDTVAIAFKTAETIPAPAFTERGIADTVPAMPRVDSPAPSARRRRLADVLIGETTCSDADIRVLRELFERMQRVFDVAPGDRLGLAAALDELWRGATAALEASQGGYVWNVAAWGFEAGGRVVWEPQPPHAIIARRLYRDGLRSFGLLTDVQLGELQRLLEIFSIADEAISPEDDRVTLLADAGFEHIAFRAIEPGAAVPAEGHESAARARRQIVAIASFDTAVQLEESWRESRDPGAESELEPFDATQLRKASSAGPVVMIADEVLAPKRVARAARAALPIARQLRADAAVARHLEPHGEPTPASISMRRHEPELDDAALAIENIAQLVALVTRAGLRAAGVEELAARAEKALRAACSEQRASMRYSFTPHAVFIGREVLPLTRQSWQTVEPFAQLMTRIGVSALDVHGAWSRADLIALASSIAGNEGAKKIDAIGGARFGPLELVGGDAETDDLARMTEGRRVLHVYASACATMREVYAALARGELVPMRAVRRAAQQLAAEERSATWSGLTTLASAHRDDAGRAVQTAIVALTVARELTRSSKLWARLACAALLAGAGRPLLTGLAGRSPDMDAALESHIPAASAAVGLTSGPSDNAAFCGVVAFESAWLDRKALLGPLGDPPPSLASELIRLSLAYLEAIAPRDRSERLTPPAALRRVCDGDDTDAALRSAFARAIGDPPPGTVIELETGEWGVVVAPTRSGDPARPVVRLVTDARGRAHPKPIEVDLGAAASDRSRIEIAGVVSPAQMRFNVSQAFFGSI